MANPFKVGQVVQMAFPPHELQVIVDTPFDDRVDIRPLRSTAGRIGVPNDWIRAVLPLQVNLEPADLKRTPPERCVDCRWPTRYWLGAQTPLCETCCAQRNKNLELFCLQNPV